MSELKLKCCPFCGGSARVVLDYQDNETWAQCTTRKPKRCPMSSTLIAIEEWNRRTQPEATKPAQDLSAAILALPEDEILQAFANAVGNERDGAKSCYVTTEEVVAFVKYHLAPRVSASPADALVAVDRVDAERYRYIRDTATLDNAVWEALEGYGMTNDAGELLEDDYRAGMDRAIDRAIQAQKDGHG